MPEEAEPGEHSEPVAAGNGGVPLVLNGDGDLGGVGVGDVSGEHRVGDTAEPSPRVANGDGACGVWPANAAARNGGWEP